MRGFSFVTTGTVSKLEVASADLVLSQLKVVRRKQRAKLLIERFIGFALKMLR
jgi:hypothetical protein